MLIKKKSGEVIEVETEEIMDAADFAALIGREDDPVIQSLVAEIRRLGSVLSNLPQSPPPIVNVSPQVSAPSVNVSPAVNVDAPRLWEVEVAEHYMTGQLQGKIKRVLFRAL